MCACSEKGIIRKEKKSRGSRTCPRSLGRVKEISPTLPLRRREVEGILVDRERSETVG